METLKSRVQKLLDSGISDDEKMSTMYCNYRREFKLTHFEMMEEPIPTILGNLEVLQKEAKEQESKMKSIKRK